jgi:hypothetical protein
MLPDLSHETGVLIRQRIVRCFSQTVNCDHGQTGVTGGGKQARRIPLVFGKIGLRPARRTVESPADPNRRLDKEVQAWLGRT